MENEVKNHDIPDFGPDDDTEDMTGVSIFDPYLENSTLFSEINELFELDMYNKGTYYGKKEKKEKEVMEQAV